MRIPILPAANPVRTAALAAFLFAAAIVLPNAPASAQTGAATKAPVPVAEGAENPPANTQPDVQIVILPLPTGTYAVSSVYPKQVPKAVAQGRVDRLLALTKWKATNRRFSDAAAPPNPLVDEKSAKGKLSAASFETGSGVYGEDGTINWDPFLRAFGDVRRINMVCFTGPDFSYRGPVSFESDRITFSASSSQGTVAAVANIKKPAPSPASFDLPQYASAAPAQAATAKKRVSDNGRTRRVAGMVLVALLATGVALVIYALTARLVTKR